MAETISKRKKPRDDSAHHEFSISRHARPAVDYTLLPTQAYPPDKSRQEREAAAAAENRLADEAGAVAGNIAVKRVKHRRSPYVLTLGKEARPTPLKTPAAASEPWRKEIKRLQRDTTVRYKTAVKKICINFLDRPRRSSGRIGKTPAHLWRAARRLPLAAIIWLYEYLLSIPLAVLLLLYLFLGLVDKTAQGLLAAARLTGRATVMVIDQAFLFLLVIIKHLIALPVKLLVVGMLALWRGLSLAGSITGSLAQNASRAGQETARALARAPGRFFRQLGSAGIIALLLLAPIKFAAESTDDIRRLRGQVLGAAEAGIGALLKAEAANPIAPLREASAQFSDAQASLQSVNIILRGLIKLTPQGQDAENLLASASELLTAGEYISAGLYPFLNKSEREADVITAVKNLANLLPLALPHIRSAHLKMASVSPASLPDDYRDKFIAARTLLPEAGAALAEFADLSASLIDVLGGAGERRYAILFQNNNELRPAGGFIGSLALARVHDGRIQDIKIPGGGSYDFQGALTKQVMAPKPLWIINPNWQLQDANWYPDWPTSAEKVAWFLENSGESSADGVIALQATTLQKLLSILGPIDFPEYKETITAANAIAKIQEAVEINYDKTANQPKKYLAELAPRVIDKILASSSGQFLDLLELIRAEVEQKNILLYFRNPQINQQFLDRQWEPTVLASGFDYLSVINANIGGGKTDGVIEETWQQAITINEKGEAEAELTVTREHRGKAEDIFEKANNVNFMRVYAPLGSALISATGFSQLPPDLFEPPGKNYAPDEELARIEGQVLLDERSGTRINNEFGKTVFGNWTQVLPGRAARATLRYKLPFNVKQNGYSLLMQKQPGARSHDFSVSLSYPADWQISWKKTGGQGTINDTLPGRVEFTGTLAKDTGFALFFSEK